MGGGGGGGATLQWKYAATCPVCSVFGGCNRNMASHMLPVTLTFDSFLPRLIQSGVCVTLCHFFLFFSCNGKILTNCFCKVSILPRWQGNRRGDFVSARAALLTFRFRWRPLRGASPDRPELGWRSPARPVAGRHFHSVA